MAELIITLIMGVSVASYMFFTTYKITVERISHEWRMKLGDYLDKTQVEFHIKYYMWEYKLTRKEAQEFLKTHLEDYLGEHEENIREGTQFTDE